jgi:hypothetical protein
VIGIWTLATCDVGSHGDWVAPTSEDLLPCCCGVNCADTDDFMHAAGLAGNSKVNSKCAAQFAGYLSVSRASSVTEAPALSYSMALIILVFLFNLII